MRVSQASTPEGEWEEPLNDLTQSAAAAAKQQFAIAQDEAEGPNASVFSVLDVPQPTPANGSYVSDASGLISPTALLYLNRNMSLMERSTPFRVLLVVMARPAYSVVASHAWQARGERNGECVVQ